NVPGQEHRRPRGRLLFRRGVDLLEDRLRLGFVRPTQQHHAAATVDRGLDGVQQLPQVGNQVGFVDDHQRGVVGVARSRGKGQPARSVRVAPASRWHLNPVAHYVPDSLLLVQRALLRLCAARADLFAVLALPEHYHEEDATAYVDRLTSPTLEVVVP